MHPLGELSGEDRVDVLAGVEALDQGRGLGGAAPHVEGPADEGTVLVEVDDRLGGEHGGDALLEFLSSGWVVSLGCSVDKGLVGSWATYLHVIGQQLLAVSRAQRDRVRDVGALGVGAEMAVADSGVSSGVSVWGKQSVLCLRQWMGL